MRQEPSEPLDLRALSIWRIYGIFNSLFFIAIAIGSIFIVVLTSTPWWISLIVIVLMGIITYLYIQVLPRVRYRVWRYEVGESEIELKFGLLMIRRVLIPINRVQHVDTKQGPILRRYRLSSVTISTAATTHEIPALDSERADQVRNYISLMARVTEEDV